MSKTLYDFNVTQMNGQTISLKEYTGKPLIIVNTASKCGFTPQFGELEKIYQTYPDLIILGFPCNQFSAQDPGSNEEIATFCQRNYGVTFPMHQKIEVKGENIDPLFEYLVEQTGGEEIQWNFTKFLIDQNGSIVERFEPKVTPEEMIPTIEKLLITKK